MEDEEKKGLDMMEAGAVKSLTDCLKLENQDDKMRDDVGQMQNNLKAITTDVKDMKYNIQKMLRFNGYSSEGTISQV
ncbi:Hypothetical predicted protein [Mytilus galloprovincialis]|uniref:Uncharacterized protein n=1 Tax=Mytilus galloprovincialis TaxID=29158 RepID=A0A8B6FK82_MYTGA|nr:Hypothetical predicted protein [Mytilus galloprovincialis]